MVARYLEATLTAQCTLQEQDRSESKIVAQPVKTQRILIEFLIECS